MVDRAHYPTKPPRQMQAMLNALRDEIVSGRLRPGERLPTRREMQHLYHVSLCTIQTVLNQLIADGFVEPRGTHGSFVSTFPPHLYRYALVFSQRVRVEEWSHFYRVLAHEAAAFQEGARCIATYIIGGWGGQIDRQRLLDDIAAQRLAGILFAPSTDLQDDATFSGHLTIPNVSIGIGPSVHFIELDHLVMMRRAIHYLAQCGRRRVAILCHQGDYFQIGAHWETFYTEVGLTLDKRWIQSLGEYGGGWSEHCLRLMFDPHLPEHPDGLIITDDNLVPEATAALVQLGIAVPEQVAVITGCNFYEPTASAVPCTRIGFDLRQVLRTGVDLVESLRAGQDVSPLTYIPPYFEEELLPSAATILA